MGPVTGVHFPDPTPPPPSDSCDPPTGASQFSRCPKLKKVERNELNEKIKMNGKKTRFNQECHVASAAAYSRAKHGMAGALMFTGVSVRLAC